MGIDSVNIMTNGDQAFAYMHLIDLHLPLQNKSMAAVSSCPLVVSSLLYFLGMSSWGGTSRSLLGLQIAKRRQSGVSEHFHGFPLSIFLKTSKRRLKSLSGPDLCDD